MGLSDKNCNDYLQTRERELFNKAKELSTHPNIEEMKLFINKINDDVAMCSALLLTICRQNINIADPKRAPKNQYKEILARLMVEIEGI